MWLNLTQLDSFDSIWLIVTQFDFWLNLTQFDSIWLNLIQFHSIWLLTQFDSTWLNLTHLTQFDSFNSTFFRSYNPDYLDEILTFGIVCTTCKRQTLIIQNVKSYLEFDKNFVSIRLDFIRFVSIFVRFNSFFSADWFWLDLNSMRGRSLTTTLNYNYTFVSITTTLFFEFWECWLATTPIEIMLTNHYTEKA